MTRIQRGEPWTCWKCGRLCRTSWTCRGCGAVDGPRKALILDQWQQQANADHFQAVRDGRARWTRCQCGRLWVQPLGEDGTPTGDRCPPCEPPKTRRPRRGAAAA